MGATATLGLLRSLAAVFVLLVLGASASADPVPEVPVVASVRPANLTDGYVLIVSSVYGAPPFDLTIEATNPQLLKNYRWHYPKFHGRIELGSLQAWDWRIGDVAVLKVNNQTTYIYDVVRSRNEYGVALDKRRPARPTPPMKIRWGAITDGLLLIIGLLIGSAILVFGATWGLEVVYDRVVPRIGKKPNRFKNIRK